MAELAVESKEERRRKRREKRREAWQTFKRTLPDAVQLARPQARLWAMGLVLLLVARLAGLVLPGAPKFLIDRAIPQQDHRLLYTIVAIVLLATVIQGFASYALTQTISKAGQRLIAALRVRIHDHVTRLGIRYYDNHKTGEVVSRVMNDVEGVRNLVGTGMVEFIGGLFTAMLALCVLLYLNWTLTLLILLFLGLSMALMIKAFSTLGPIFKERQSITGEVTGRLTESIAGVRVVKAYNREDAERATFASGIDRLLQNVLRTINGIGIVALVSSVLVGVLGSLIMVVGGRQLIAGTLSTGEFISYVLYLGFMIAPISSIVMIGTQLSEAFAGLERMREVLGQLREDLEEKNREALAHMEGRIEFRDVGFEYEAGKPVLHGIDFLAEPGTVTALVGPSGSGKSTLIGLVARFFAPTSGMILLDERDVAALRLYDFRRKLGVVLQENFLFAGTIRENIVYAKPDATAGEVERAARLAHCFEFIDRMPAGLDTVVGERGVKLSGGQRQRLAIARALLADPAILILDEATSALDSESEAAIQEGLATLMKGRTTFVIAHRLSTIRTADQILVLEDGRIIERGTHRDLLNAGGRYSDMYRRQHGAEENLFLCEGESDVAGEGETAPKTGGNGAQRPDIMKLIAGE